MMWQQVVLGFVFSKCGFFKQPYRLVPDYWHYITPSESGESIPNLLLLNNPTPPLTSLPHSLEIVFGGRGEGRQVLSCKIKTIQN